MKNIANAELGDFNQNYGSRMSDWGVPCSPSKDTKILNTPYQIQDNL
jgi:hypothetical protein